MIMHTQELIPFKRRRNLHRNVKRFYKKYSVYNRKMNEFGEIDEDILVKDIDGFYYTDISKISRKEDHNGKIVVGRAHYIQVSDRSDINAGMHVVIDGKRYEIIDIEDEAGLGISYILTLEDKRLYVSGGG